MIQGSKPFSKRSLRPDTCTPSGKHSFDKKPISFTELKSCGALEPTNAGIQAMVNVADTSRDKVRPRRGFTQNNAKSWLHVPEDMERIRVAQALRIELESRSGPDGSTGTVASPSSRGRMEANRFSDPAAAKSLP
jgi:hypothetical protein